MRASIFAGLLVLAAAACILSDVDAVTSGVGESVDFLPFQGDKLPLHCNSRVFSDPAYH